MKKTKLFILTINMFIHTFAFAQQEDYSWWNSMVNWDGITNWSHYIVKSSGYMGPNALPVPLVKNGITGETFDIETSAELHFGNNEQTQNPYIDFYYPVAKNKIAVQIFGRSFEHYKTSMELKNFRKCRSKSPEGFSKGDYYFSTTMQIFNENKFFLNLLGDFTFKTTSGKNLANARHTDAPAYYFSTNASKTLFQNNLNTRFIRLALLYGIYVWQIDTDKNRQDDAHLYGFRSDFKWEKFMLSMSIAGYSGYLNIRDKPIVLRSNIYYKIKKLDVILGYQYGLRDFIQNTYKIGLIYHVNISNNN